MYISGGVVVVIVCSKNHCRFQSDVRELTRQQLPELLKKLPELSDDTEHDGLVKSGRDIQQYDVMPLTDTSATVYQSHFNGEPVVIKVRGERFIFAVLPLSGACMYHP